MATNAPNTRCMVCGQFDQYEAVPRERAPGSPLVFGPTEWRLVSHQHTQDEINAWLDRSRIRNEQSAQRAEVK